MSESTSALQAEPTTKKPAAGPLRTYLAASRNLLNSLVLVVPLFVIYQVGVLTTGGVQNGVDFVTNFLRFTVFGGDVLWYVGFNFAVLLGLVVAAFMLRKKERFTPKVLGLVILESTCYGLLLGGIVGTILAKLGIEPSLAAGLAAQLSPMDNFILSLGAGLYEELVFRLILLGGSVWFMAKVVKIESVWAVIGAVVVTSLIFSGIHYIGSMGDDFQVYSFSFRFVAGVIFAGLYYVRGFAVAVYTHAIYDVFVLVF